MSKKNKQFWSIQNLVNDSNKGEIYLYEDIASYESWWNDEITPKQFKADLDNLGDVSEIELHINSNGGDVFAANAIYSMLKNHKAKITTFIDGICASAATIPALASDFLKMSNNAFIMIHNPSISVSGEAEDLLKAADLLDKVKKTIMSNYTKKTGLSDEEISQMMTETTWLTAEEALEKGFIDEITDKELEISMSGNFVVMDSVKHDLKNMKNFPTNKIKNSAKKAPEGMENMTPEEIRNKYPEVFKQISNAAQAVERERIASIDNLSLPGAEDVITNAKKDGLSAADTAIRIVNWQQENNTKLLNQMKNETNGMEKIVPGNTGFGDDDPMDAILNKITSGVK